MAIDLPSKEIEGLLARALFGRADRRARERAEFVAKLDAYLSTMTLFANSLGTRRSTAPRSKLGQALDWAASKIDLLSSDAQDEFLSHMLFPKAHEASQAQIEAFARTQTQLATVSPHRVRLAMQRVSGVLIEWSQHPDADRTDDWLVASRDLRRAADYHLAAWPQKAWRVVKSRFAHRPGR